MTADETEIVIDLRSLSCPPPPHCNKVHSQDHGNKGPSSCSIADIPSQCMQHLPPCASSSSPSCVPCCAQPTSPPPEKIKCLLAVGVSVVGTGFASSMIVLNNDRVPLSQPPLPDIMFDLFPRTPFAFQTAECIILLFLLLVLAVLVLHQHRWILLRRMLVILGLIYFMRGVCLYVTTLPNPHSDKTCSAPSESVSETWRRAFSLFSRLGLSVAGQNYCGDLIFSGHSVSIIGLYLFIVEYTPQKLRVLRAGCFLLAVLAVFLVMVSREHYTIDVLIAYYLVTRLHWNYHTIANMPVLQKTSGRRENLLARSILHPIVLFFEGNVGGPLPNEYTSPHTVISRILEVAGGGYKLLRQTGPTTNHYRES